MLTVADMLAARRRAIADLDTEAQHSLGVAVDRMLADLDLTSGGPDDAIVFAEAALHAPSNPRRATRHRKAM